MSYDYQKLRPDLFSEHGIDLVIKIRDHVKPILDLAGAVRLDQAIRGASGDDWIRIAALDYLKERGELREVSQNGVPGQHRIFVAGPNWRT